MEGADTLPTVPGESFEGRDAAPRNAGSGVPLWRAGLLLLVVACGAVFVVISATMVALPPRVGGAAPLAAPNATASLVSPTAVPTPTPGGASATPTATDTSGGAGGAAPTPTTTTSPGATATPSPTPTATPTATLTPVVTPTPDPTVSGNG
jgi:hypothetical protein